MVVPIIKNFLSAFIRLGSRVTPKLTPIATQVIRASKKTNVQKPPENIADMPANMEEVFLRATYLPEQVIYELKNVAVSWGGIVLKGLHVFLPSLAYSVYEEEYSGTFLLRQWISKKVTLNKTVALVYDNWSVTNYYHWLVDTLPRLLLLRERYPDCTLLVPFPVPEYVSFTIAALGFRDTFALTKNSFVQVQHLIMPSHVNHPGYQDVSLIRGVRKALLKSFENSGNSTPPSSARRIYVSRSRQKIRRLLNEEEILPLLSQYDFEIVYFEEMSFEQQIEVVRHAEVLMGVHGANLTNMLFMSSGSHVIELLNEGMPNPCYFQLASNLELNYHALPCPPSLSSDYINNDDISVDAAWLTKILASL